MRCSVSLCKHLLRSRCHPESPLNKRRVNSSRTSTYWQLRTWSFTWIRLPPRHPAEGSLPWCPWLGDTCKRSKNGSRLFYFSLRTWTEVFQQRVILWMNEYLLKDLLTGFFKTNGWNFLATLFFCLFVFFPPQCFLQLGIVLSFSRTFSMWWEDESADLKQQIQQLQNAFFFGEKVFCLDIDVCIYMWIFLYWYSPYTYIK